jgi:hypothetical protein
MFSEPTHYWRVVTPGEVATLVAIGIAAFLTANVAIARNRYGAPPYSFGILDRINRVFDYYTAFNTIPRTPFEAQIRYEWQRKGWLMPAAIAILVLGGIVVWYFGSRDPQDLLVGFLGGGGALWMIGFLGGIVFGNSGPNDADFKMGNYVATRPIADGDLARAILKTAATSVFISWLIWAIAFAVVCVVFVLAGSFTFPQLENANWLLYPGSLLGPWIVVATLASILLLGRARLVIITFAGLCAAFIASAIVSTLLPTELKSLLSQTVLTGGSIIVLLACPLLFAAARHKLLISSATNWASAAFWIVAVTLLGVFWPRSTPFTISAFLLTVAALTLAVLPLAAAPLAVAINRHR